MILESRDLYAARCSRNCRENVSPSVEVVESRDFVNQNKVAASARRFEYEKVPEVSTVGEWMGTSRKSE
jgi:hypothetical protein